MASEKVWCKFSVKKSDGVVVNLRIQDLPSDLLDDAVDVNIRYFTPEETFHRAAVTSAIITLRLWFPDKDVMIRDQRLEDYQDDVMKKMHGKRFLPWKPYSDTDRFEVKENNVRYILIWTTAKDEPFRSIGLGNEVFADKLCPHYNCFITDDVNFFKDETEFDAILFGAEVTKLTENLLPEQRLPYQKYVFISTRGAQDNTVCTQKFDGYFNWTWTYRLDSDIRTGLVVRDESENIVAPKKEVHWETKIKSLPKDVAKIIANKTTAAAWIVSDCSTPSHREKIALTLREELKKYSLTLDIYGDCGDLTCEEEKCGKIIETKYYFYLAFENSLSEDYVSEELLWALHNYAVPIVYGGANYTRILPPHSYLDANKLSVQKLAIIMSRLIENKYIESFFWWKEHYFYFKTSDSVDTDEFCNLCRLLNSDKFNESSNYANFREWWNNKDEICLNWYEK